MDKQSIDTKELLKFKDDLHNKLIDVYQNSLNTSPTLLTIFVDRFSNFSTHYSENAKYIAQLSVSVMQVFSQHKVEEFYSCFVKEQKQMIERQRQIHIMLDDFAIYDVDQFLMYYAFTTFKETLKQQFQKLVKQYVDNFENSSEYNQIICIVNQALSENKQARIQSLENEYAELRSKIEKLNKFLFSENVKNVSKRQRQLLEKQLICMSEYSSTLKLRIEDLENNDD